MLEFEFEIKNKRDNLYNIFIIILYKMIENKTGIFTTDDSNNSIYMIGDIHGDYQCLIHCLVDLSEVCNISLLYNDKEFLTINREHLEWNKGNNSIVVFCGDMIHRKRFVDHVLDDECSDIYIIQTLLRLKKEAKMNGGDIIIISGNHEILNILDPENTMYTSNKNLDVNDKYFNNKEFINEYILNSYAWIKINNILISHGGLCSDYLRYLDEENIFEEKIYSDTQEKNKTGGSLKSNKFIDRSKTYYMLGGRSVEEGDGIVEFVNDKYRSFFTNLNKREIEKDITSYNLFVRYDTLNKNKLNIFWCREWGYSGINCDKFKEILIKVGCSKMIIAHCPQFVSPDYPKMINFECIDLESLNDSGETNSFNIARIDLGMSRSFDYNKQDNFLYYLANNYNRKMSVLKLVMNRDGQIIFNIECIITKKISCIQYMLLKYGLTKENWEYYNSTSNWLGFEYLKKALGYSKLKSFEKSICQCGIDCKEIDFTKAKSSEKKTERVEWKETIDIENLDQIITCLIYPITNCKLDIQSINQFKKLFEET